MTLQPQANLSVDPQVLLDFLLTFSRMEYALKACGFRSSNSRKKSELSPPIRASWSKFAKSVAPQFSSSATGELEEACWRLLNNPPWREVLVGDDQIMWDSYLGERAETELERLLLFVRTRRNNLFHGGDFSQVASPEPAAVGLLLADSLVLLEACLQLSPAVRNEFENAVL